MLRWVKLTECKPTIGIAVLFRRTMRNGKYRYLAVNEWTAKKNEYQFRNAESIEWSELKGE